MNHYFNFFGPLEFFNTLSQELTFVGRIERGFDLLGFHFRPGELSDTIKTIEKFVARAIRLTYEVGRAP